MTKQTNPDRVSRRRMIFAAAQGLGWRFVGTRLRAARARRQATASPSQAWLLAADGRPAIGSPRDTD